MNSKTTEETNLAATRGLMEAFMNEYATPEQVKSFIDAGANVNFADMYGTTLLMKAIRNEQSPDVIKILIEAGADVNAKDEWDSEALRAWHDEHPFAYTWRECEKEGWTALMTAVAHSRTSETEKILTDILIEAGADVRAYYEESTDNGAYYMESVLSLAIRCGCSAETIKLLIEAGADIDERCYYEYDERYIFEATLLMLATRHSYPEVIRVLVEAGVDIEAKDDFGDNALMWAVRHEINEETYPDADNVKALISLGADVNAKGNCGDTALIYSASEDDTEMLQVLIDAGADLYAENMWGRTALTEAASPEVIEILLNSNFRVNSRNNKGMTPLMKACYYGNVEAAEALIKAEEAIAWWGFARDKKDRTALMFACSPYSGHPSIETVQALINAKFTKSPINAKDNKGRTALMYAVSCGGDIEVVKTLIRAGANVNAKDSRLGKTILMEAAMKANNPEVIKILIRAGADIDAKDKIGSTVTDYAELNTHSEILSLIAELIKEE